MKKRKVQEKSTQCSDCGTTIKYKTKPKKRCKKCWRVYHAKRNKKGKPKPKKWTHENSTEAYIFKILDNSIFPNQEFINHGYYSWLRSPKGYPLQLDRYYPKLALAIEYLGQQHFEYNNYFHGNKKNFNYLQECDKIKERECKKNGVILVKISYKDLPVDESKIREKIKEAGFNL